MTDFKVNQGSGQKGHERVSKHLYVSRPFIHSTPVCATVRHNHNNDTNGNGLLFTVPESLLSRIRSLRLNVLILEDDVCDPSTESQKLPIVEPWEVSWRQEETNVNEWTRSKTVDNGLRETEYGPREPS